VVAGLVIATLLDLGLGLLLVAVSGFILEGVNNTGAMMPDAVFLVLMIALCIAAPLAAWLLRKRLAASAVLLLAYAPLMIAALVLLAEPLFV
jgi:hypothetical protein